MIKGAIKHSRIVVCAALLALAACSSDKPEYAEQPVDELYNKATNSMESGDYKEAARLYDEVERQHPYSEWASRAQIMAAYAHYQANQYDDAVLGLERFIELHPASPEVDYAYYLRALCYYERISDPARDQEMTEKARHALEDVISRFPDSQYARDARIKLDLTIDHLAAKEMVVGRFYLHQAYYTAAINRFKTVIDHYQTTTHVPEALLRLTEAYTALGLTEQAKRMVEVLAYNYPQSEWYSDAHKLVYGSAVAGVEKEPWYQFW